MVRKTLILGLGNDILMDDGIGPMLINDLANIIIHPDVDFNTSACGGLEIMEYIKGYGKVIFIDGMRNRDGKPGDICHFRPQDFRETLNLSNLHDVNFLTALEMGKSLGIDLPSDLHIIGVDIIEDMEFSEELTPELTEKYPDVLTEVISIVNKIIQ